jgi:hypothetical protein
MDIIEKYQEEKKRFEDACKTPLIQEIESHLEKLRKDEVIPLNSDSCDGNGIMTGEYTDTINILTSDGGCPVYNNTDCNEAFMAYHEAAFGQQNVHVLVEILKCVREYMENRNASLKEELKKASNHLDKSQEILKKLFGEENKTTKEIYDLRCKLEDIKEDINETISK